MRIQLTRNIRLKGRTLPAGSVFDATLRPFEHLTFPKAGGVVSTMKTGVFATDPRFSHGTVSILIAFTDDKRLPFRVLTEV